MIKYTLYERMSEIRDFINRPRKQHFLLQDRNMWHKLCNTMDAIEDTDRILQDFIKEYDDCSDKDIELLPTSNVFDNLVAQQTAVEKLHESLRIPYTKDRLLEEILQLCKLQIKNIGVNKAPIKTNIPELIAKQIYIFKNMLNIVIKLLREEELAHRRKYRNKKLSNTFQITTYWFEKIYDAIFSEKSPHTYLVGSHVDSILGSVNEFKVDLKERGEPDDNLSDIYENLDYSLKHIKTYFHNKKDTHLQEKDVYIFAYFARRQVRELENVAQYLDEEYSSEYIIRRT